MSKSPEKKDQPIEKQHALSMDVESSKMSSVDYTEKSKWSDEDEEETEAQSESEEEEVVEGGFISKDVKGVSKGDWSDLEDGDTEDDGKRDSPLGQSKNQDLFK